jgi:hypothetical protein
MSRQMLSRSATAWWRVPNPQIGYYQITPHGYQIKVLAAGVDASVFAICSCAGIYGQSCWCPHNRSQPPCPECESGAPPHHFVWCPLYEETAE